MASTRHPVVVADFWRSIVIEYMEYSLLLVVMMVFVVASLLGSPNVFCWLVGEITHQPTSRRIVGDMLTIYLAVVVGSL